jgi:hypothetical protein
MGSFWFGNTKPPGRIGGSGTIVLGIFALICAIPVLFLIFAYLYVFVEWLFPGHR